jgi:hypothetical protein
VNPVWATFIGTIAVQLIIAAFVYGKLTEKVKTVTDRSIDHGRRVTNIETVISGTGGHGERLTALEAWRIESREKKHS